MLKDAGGSSLAQGLRGTQIVGAVLVVDVLDVLDIDEAVASVLDGGLLQVSLQRYLGNLEAVGNIDDVEEKMQSVVGVDDLCSGLGYHPMTRP